MSELSTTQPRLLPPKGLLLALAAQLPLLASSWPLHAATWELAAGLALIVIGSVLNVWAERLFKHDNVGVCPFTHVPVLVVRGPFRVTRNPMYLGLVCLTLGCALASGVLANVWSAIALFIWLHYAFVLPEEAFLRDALGSEFDSYARRVPRWLSFSGTPARGSLTS
jgi:protein-S-isoprenylcysteine O-methyltransferase Ste14